MTRKQLDERRANTGNPFIDSSKEEAAQIQDSMI